MEKTLLNKGSFNLKITTETTPPGLLELIEATRLGTKGLKYRHGRVADRLKHTHNPYFLSLDRGGDIMANVTLARYSTFGGYGTANAYYVRYFAFKQSYKTSTKEKSHSSGDNLIKKLIGRVMQKHPAEQGLSYGESISDPSFQYAFIEPDNMRSLHHALGFDFKLTRKFQTFPFTRGKPKKKVEFTRIKPEEKEEVKALLADYYSDHNGVHFHYLFHHDNFFIVRDDAGEVIAACQANDCLFHIDNTGSKVINGIAKALKFTGLAKYILDIDNLRFLSFDHLYYKEGHEQTLIFLFESLLAEFKLNLSLMWFDVESEHYKMLKGSGKAGWINHFYSPTPNAVVTHNLNLSEEQQKTLKTRPWFIAAFDVT